MMKWAEKYPEYGFDRHMGYGTKQHIEAIQRFGLSPIHLNHSAKKSLPSILNSRIIFSQLQGDNTDEPQRTWPVGRRNARPGILLMKKVFVLLTVTTNVDLVRSTLLQLNKIPLFLSRLRPGVI